ncbi:MAG: YitT family protein [Anaerofustis sp.]
MKKDRKKKLKKILRTILDYFMVTVGCGLMAISFNMFCVPHQIAPGGFSGLAAVGNYIFGVPIGLTTFVMCVPLFIILFKDMGLKSFIKSLFGTGMFSLIVDLTSGLPSFVDDIFLASVFGGIILGLGLGIVFKFRGTTGGTDLLAMLLYRKFSSITIGTWLLLIDFCVVAIAGLVLGKVEIALYSIITIYASMKMIDLMQDGVNYLKAFYIFSSEPDTIKDVIFEKLNRGVTYIKAMGGYTNQNKDILLCVVKRNQITELKEIIKETDPDAFVILADVYEVMGEGFEK